VRGIKQIEQLWALSQPLLKTSSMAEPSLPFSLFCFDRKPTGIYLALSDLLGAKATRPPLDDRTFVLRLLVRHAPDYTRRFENRLAIWESLPAKTLRQSRMTESAQPNANT
jgi:hypothetical protein